MYRSCKALISVLMAALLVLEVAPAEAATGGTVLAKGAVVLKRGVGAGRQGLNIATKGVTKGVQTGMSKVKAIGRLAKPNKPNKPNKNARWAAAKAKLESGFAELLARRGLTPVDAKSMAVMVGTIVGLMGLSALVGGAVRHDLMVAAAPMDVGTFEGEVSLNSFAMPSELALAEVGVQSDPTSFHDAKTFIAKQTEISQLLGTRLNLTSALSTLEVLDKLTSYSDGGPFPRHLGEMYSPSQPITLMVNPESLGKLHAFDTLVDPSLRHGVDAGLFQSEPGTFDYKGTASHISVNSTDDRVLKEQLVRIPQGLVSPLWLSADVGLTTMSRDLGNGTMDLGRLSLEVVMPSMAPVPLPEPITMSQANATEQFIDGYNVTRNYAITSAFGSGAEFGQAAQELLINASRSNEAVVPRIIGDSAVVTSVSAR